MDRRIVVVLGTHHALQGIEKLDDSRKIDDPTYGVLVKELVKPRSIDYIFEEVSSLGPTTHDAQTRGLSRRFWTMC